MTGKFGRSVPSAIFAPTGALGQLWLFSVAPLVGAALGGAIWKWLSWERGIPVAESPRSG